MTALLDFAASDTFAGFRLHRVELYNWGTFHERVWTLHTRGRNALLTGEIGSGKSTIVDAVTTLLVPAQRITYNKAAGAQSRERTLRSYVLGHYKSERAAEGAAARPVPLRDPHSYSVILARFYNEGFDQGVTLAQVFWHRDVQGGQPARFYVVSEADLSIADDFADFGSDMAKLKKRLRKSSARLFDTFPPYGAAFRRLMGIENTQALELFNQTVSMKSVGNLTDFVRAHMLEPFPVGPRIDALVAHFDDLSRAHEAVVKAREQIGMLDPLVRDGDLHEALAAEAGDLRGCRDGLRAWFAALEATLLEARIGTHDRRLGELKEHLEALERQRSDQLRHRDAIKADIHTHGGDRIERLKAEIDQKREEKAERKRRAESYDETATALDFPPATDAASFRLNRELLQQERLAAGDMQAELQNKLTEATVEMRQLKDSLDEVDAELESLRRRRSNLPSAMLAIRERLTEALGLPVEDLPFAGELLQVREEERRWEGATERVLHNFALSLLVPEAHYRSVAQWVDQTHLRGRLVYFRVRGRRRASATNPGPDSLVRKLSVRPDSELYEWLEDEIARRFDYTCCERLADFSRAERAITAAGQIKTTGGRHEKDDRHRIDDRARYVLGWTNEAKIAALEGSAQVLRRRCQDAGGGVAATQEAQRKLQTRMAGLEKLSASETYRDLDWRPLVLQIEALETERRELQARSDKLRALQEQLAALDDQIATTERQRTAAIGDQAAVEEKNRAAAKRLLTCKREIETTSDADRTRYFPMLEAMRGDGLGDEALTVETCARRQTAMLQWLRSKIDGVDAQLKRVRDRVIAQMGEYTHRWPLETREVDRSIESIGEYRQMLHALTADDLPRFEQRFKTLLNENTIREVAGFQAQLSKEREAIRERLDTINRSLRAIDYNPGRYIKLVAESAADTDVRDFQQELRACTEGALTGSGDTQYTETKFLEVQRIVERFKGREGQAEADRRWTTKVTDVRHWFAFSASERWREDDAEHEHYSDSGGKSGGQKEKLAYTVLAASLAYQFGLQWGEKRSRSFRFVVIDEAFARGSDDSARYGLELFERLNLQLLIVTPLQKIHIIEPYVAGVGFVHCEDGRQSRLRNLTIEEYRLQKQAWAAAR